MYELDTMWFKTVLDIPVIMTYRKGTNDRGVINSVMTYDEYYAKVFDYEDGDTFIDLGAHIGTWSVLMATLNPTFKVYSIEPIPENYAMLKKNIQLNHLSNIIPLNRALSDKSIGTEDIYYTNDDTNFGKAHKFVGSMLGGSGQILNAPRISLEDVFDTQNIKNCRVVKTDCEGCEVKGFATLSIENLKKIDYIVGEFHASFGVDYDKFLSFFEPYFIDISEDPLEYGESATFRRFIFKRLIE